MCGICGIVSVAELGDTELTATHAMTQALSHRGPDEEGVWHHAHAALGARRLKIVDLVGGQQPMHGDDGSVLVFNGEIYNALTLRADLEGRGCVFRSASDTEVLLRALELWGIDALAHLNGMFAFAWYDPREERLLLARDRLGIKPLYYLRRGDTIVFNSEIDSLLRSGYVSGRIDPAALDDYFTYLHVPGPDSIFADVQQVMPGEYLTFLRGTERVERYWSSVIVPDTSWTLDSAAERYRELLTDSVRLRRVSDVPLGAFLSGGMDSSCVVAAMAETGGDTRTFTIGFDEPDADESAYAQAVVERFETKHTSARLRPDPVSALQELVPFFGQPFADSSLIATRMVSGLARESVTVALSGDGGDELFAGYSWLHMTERVLRYARTPSALRGIAHAVLRGLPKRPLSEKVQRFSADSFTSAREIFRRRQSCFYDDERSAMYGDAFRDALNPSRDDRFVSLWEELQCGADTDRMLLHDMRFYLPGDVLTKVDRMSMSVSLEARVPLLDHRIVEFANTLPFELKYSGGISKRVAKHAYKDLLPESVLTQRKRGFALPVNAWFRGELAEMFEDTVLTEEARSVRWLKHAALRANWEEHRAGRRDLGHRLFSLLVFELWLRYVEDYTDIGLEKN